MTSGDALQRMSRIAARTLTSRSPPMIARTIRRPVAPVTSLTT